MKQIQMQTQIQVQNHTSMSQKLRRVLLLVGVVDSAVLPPTIGGAPAAWFRKTWDGLCLKTREPLRCLGLSLASFSSGRGLVKPEEDIRDIV